MKQFSLEEYLKNPNRKVVTRDGRNVTIHCTNYQGTFPVIAEVEGLDYSMAFMDDGGYHCIESSIYDLFFTPEKKVCWANIYRGKDEPVIGHIFNSEEEARESSRHCNSYTKDLYLGTAKIEWEEE